MSQIPPDSRQPQPLNYERAQGGSSSSPALRIVIFVLASVALLAALNWLAFTRTSAPSAAPGPGQLSTQP